MFDFEIAERENIWLRLLLSGPTKSGKSEGALSIATSLADALGGAEIVALDAEHDRLKLYANRFRFRHAALADFSPEGYVSAIDAAERAYPGGILVIDQVSHEWSGRGGLLEQVDRFGGWKEATPRHQAFTERIAAVQMHVVVCVRAKMKYAQDEEETNGRKRQVVRKLGVGPEQRDNFIYDFDLVGDVDLETHLTRFESRDGILADRDVDLRDPEVGQTLAKWLMEGVEPTPVEEADEVAIENLRGLLISEGYAADVIEERFTVARRSNRGKLHPDYVAEQTEKAETRIAARQPAEPEPIAS